MRFMRLPRIVVALVMFFALFAVIAPQEGFSQSCFKRGDANQDGSVDEDDVTFLLEALTMGGPLPRCEDAADVNDDGIIAIDDTIALQNYLSFGGSIAAPGDCDCGVDPTADTLSCPDYPCPFLRGDANCDGVVDMADATAVNQLIFSGIPLSCEDGADANDDGVIDVADALLILSGGPFPHPFPNCGMDLTADSFKCACCGCVSSGVFFLRGDVNSDGVVNDQDVMDLGSFLSTGSPTPPCLDAADVDDNGIIDNADVLLLIPNVAVTVCGPPIPAPTPYVCGPDPTTDTLSCLAPECCPPLQDFRRSDCDQSGTTALGDAITLLTYLFPPPPPAPRPPEPDCLDACDCNDSGCLTLADVICLLSFSFSGGAPPPAPGSDTCGFDPTPADVLSCVRYSVCD